MTFNEVLNQAKNGDFIIGTGSDGLGICIHKYKDKVYTRYGVVVDESNPHLNIINDWDIAQKGDYSDILSDIMHQFSVGEAKRLDFINCGCGIYSNEFDEESFRYSVNRQLYEIYTSSYSYMKNVYRILSLVKNAVESGVYSHIYVFVKDEWLYKDTANKTPYSHTFEVTNAKYNITYIFVRENASCVGFINDRFEINPLERILRIYDQRVTEGLTKNDITASFFTSQQEHDDCVYFLSEDAKSEKKHPDIKDSAEYSIDLFDKSAVPHVLYAKSLALIFDKVHDEIDGFDNRMDVKTNLTFMNMI